MALINCPECGKEMSDKALACPNCGAALSELSKINVRFWRKKSFNGSLCKWTVYIDGAILGVIGSGSEFSVGLEPGLHNMQADPAGPNSNPTVQDFSIPEGCSSVSVELKRKGAWTGGNNLVVAAIEAD